MQWVHTNYVRHAWNLDNVVLHLILLQTEFPNVYDVTYSGDNAAEDIVILLT